MNSTQNLKYDHTYVRRLGHVAESCSSKLYNDEDIPIEDLEIISVVMEEFVDRFLKAYSVFITDHTRKEDKFFDLIENKHSISEEEDAKIRKHYENCKNQNGGEIRIQKMIDLLEYLENREWIKT